MIAAMMVMTIAAKAQNEVGQVTLKPMVGITNATITDDDDSKSRVGLAAGAELEYGVAQNFGLTVGAVYSMQGAKSKMDGQDLKINNDYINVPILANYYVVSGLAIKAGIQPGFKVNSKIKYNGTDYTDALNKLGLEVNSFDFSIPVGLSYEISDFVIDARYQWGLTKVFKDTPFLDGNKSKNSVFMITVGYKFGL